MGDLDKSGVKEYRIMIDTNEDIDQDEINTQATSGWRLVQVINSRISRAFDRYYFERIKHDE